MFDDVIGNRDFNIPGIIAMTAKGPSALYIDIFGNSPIFVLRRFVSPTQR